jgi:hypothetical protein
VHVSTLLIRIGDLGLLLQNVVALNSAQFLGEAAKMGVRWAEVTVRRCHLEVVKAISEVEISRIRVSYNEDL